MPKRNNYEVWTYDQLNSRIEEYWLKVYQYADERNVKALMIAVFALKNLYKHRDIKL